MLRSNIPFLWPQGQAKWLGEVIRWPTGAQILNLSVWRGPISDHFLSNSSIYEAKGVQIEAPKYGCTKVFKKRWFDDLSKQWKWCSRLSGSAISSKCTRQLSDFKITSFWTHFYQYWSPMWPPKTPNEHFDRVTKNDIVNMRIETCLPRGRGGAGIWVVLGSRHKT